MHVFPSFIIGFVVWTTMVIFTSVNLYVVGAGPLIVSALSLVACAMPAYWPRRPR